MCCLAALKVSSREPEGRHVAFVTGGVTICAGEAAELCNWHSHDCPASSFMVPVSHHQDYLGVDTLGKLIHREATTGTIRVTLDDCQ